MNVKQFHKCLYNCKKCQTLRQIDSPFIGIGNFNANIMFIGERPGYQTRQRNGITFCGNKSGDFFLDNLATVGINFCNAYFTNIVKCQTDNNVVPTECEILNCITYLQKEIDLILPKMIVCVGKISEKYMKLINTNSTILHILHPSFILRTGGIHSNYYNKWFNDLVKIGSMI